MKSCALCVARTWSAVLVALCNVNWRGCVDSGLRPEGEHLLAARRSEEARTVPGPHRCEKTLLRAGLRRGARRHAICDHGDDRNANLRNFAASDH